MPPIKIPLLATSEILRKSLARIQGEPCSGLATFRPISLTTLAYLFSDKIICMTSEAREEKFSSF